MNLSRKIGNSPRTAVAVLLVVLGWMAPGAIAVVQAQNGNTSVTATLADASIDVGDETQYQISVLNDEAENAPPAPLVPGLTIQYAGHQQSSQFYSNSTGTGLTARMIYIYRVRASKPGRYVIPGQDVSVAGNSFRTLPVTLIVQGNADGTPPPGQTTSVELIVPKKIAYLGESIPLEVRASFGIDMRFQADGNVILNGAGFSVQKFTPPRLNLQVINGARFNTATYYSAIAGVKTGPLTVGPVETEPTIQLPRTRQRNRANDPFDNPFFGNGFGMTVMQQPRQVKITSEPLTVEILPLPPGKPESFSGAIGQFNLVAEAETRQAQVGDPITVRLVLSGKGNFDRVTAPTLADERGLRTYPSTAHFKADDEVNLSGIKTFEQVVIADGPRDSLPGYRFSYLDPETGKYQSLDTPPIPVKITGTAVVPPPVAPTALATAPGASATPTATPPRKAEDILYIRSDHDALRDRSTFLPVYLRPEFWRWQAVPLALLLVSGLTVAMRMWRGGDNARRSALQRQRAELQRALRTETTGRRDFYTAATRLAQMRAARGRQDLDPKTADSVQAIFHRHDELAYSGGQVALEPVPADERRGVLATLETLEKQAR